MYVYFIHTSKGILQYNVIERANIFCYLIFLLIRFYLCVCVLFIYFPVTELGKLRIVPESHGVHQIDVWGDKLCPSNGLPNRSELCYNICI